MPAAADAVAFTPPPEPAAVRGFVLAVIAHLLLIVALSLGINWDKDTTPASVEAELWSALPQEAAPPPAPPPAPEPQPVVQAPPPAVQAPPPPVAEKAPDIALEREKKRRQEEQARREQEEEKRKLEAQKKKQLEEQARKEQREEKARKEQLAKEQLAREKQAKEKLAKEQATKDKARRELDSKKLEQMRKENLQRMLADASGDGSPSSRGAAQKSSGPSDSYGGRIRARVKPNIVFADDLPGNPSAEVEVRMAPDGTITSRKITKSSGVKSWDDAVLRALDKTEVLPRDVDGRVHTPLIIEFRLRG